MDERLAESLLTEISCIADWCRHLIVVTNEVFADGVCYARETEAYREGLAKMNCRLAEWFDVAVEVIYTIPIKIKYNEIDKNDRIREQNGREDTYESIM